MGNTLQGLAIELWCKTLRPMFVKKVSIICASLGTLLNKRIELISKCRHKNKVSLRLKQTWRLTKAIANMKLGTEQTMKLE